MRIKTFGSVIALSCAGTAMVTACGDDTTLRTNEPCEAQSAECVSDKVGRACPDDDEPGWVYFTCDDGQICSMGACVLDASQAGRLGLCDEGEKECVSDALARQCAKGGNSWVPLACPSGTICDDGDCVPAGDAGGVMVCDPGKVECATEYASRTCQNDGSGWVVKLCSDGEVCSDGTCVADVDNTCRPNTQQCLNSSGGLRCKADGQGYEEFSCPAEAPCDGFKCMGPVCSPGETKCWTPSADDLFGDIYGQTFGTQQLFTCNAAGTGWEVSNCALDEMCVFQGLTPSEMAAYEQVFVSWFNDWYEDSSSNATPPQFIYPPDRPMMAACVAPDCVGSHGSEWGQTVCGDPTDLSDAKVDSFARCQGLAPFSEPHWVPFTCAAPELCDPNSFSPDDYYGPTDPCDTDCTPGETMCNQYFGNNNDGYVVCDENGEWGSPVSCNPGTAAAEICHQSPPEFGELYSAMCVDPFCNGLLYVAEYYGNSSILEYYGVCDGDQLLPCDETGHIADPGDGIDCPDNGYCMSQNNSYYGHIVGVCETECQEGETKCVDLYDYYGQGFGQANSPFYLECEGGRWNPQPLTCANDELCFQSFQYAQEDSLMRDVICGGECVPGFRQCSDDYEGIETCSAQGTWGTAEACDVGQCTNEQPPYYVSYPIWDAECYRYCAPGEHTYQYNYYSDADQYFYEDMVCGDDGRWGDPVRCEAGDSWNYQVGCYECYGPELAYYWTSYRQNYNYQPENVPVASTCDEDGNLVWCGADNRWPDTGTSCGAGKQCLPYYFDGYPNSRAACIDEQADGAPIIPDWLL